MGFPIGDFVLLPEHILREDSEGTENLGFSDKHNVNGHLEARPIEIRALGDLLQSVEDPSSPGNTCCCSPEQ